MRRIAISFFCLTVLAISSPGLAQNADAEEAPLYREFRVLSGLPWEEAGSTRASVLPRIFAEPRALVRNEVLWEYLHTGLPAKEFPAAFDECMALEAAVFPDTVPELVMRAWAERDPTAAIQHCEALFDLVIEGAPLEFDRWSQAIPVGNLEKLRASRYWFGSRGVVHACWEGLATAVLPPESRKALAAKFTAAYVRRFQESPPEGAAEPAWKRGDEPDRPPSISTDDAMHAQFFRLLAAPPEEIPGMLSWPSDPWKDVTFTRALIRWMNGDAKKAPQIVEHVLDAYDPRRAYRGDPAAKDVIPTEFLTEWAILDRAGFMAWASGDRRGWRALAVSLAVMPEEDPGAVQSKVQDSRRGASESVCRQLWISLDPQSAILWLVRDGQGSGIAKALDDLCSSDPPANLWRRAVAPYIDQFRPGGFGGEAQHVMKVWGPVDLTAMVKQYAMP